MGFEKKPKAYMNLSPFKKTKIDSIVGHNRFENISHQLSKLIVFYQSGPHQDGLMPSYDSSLMKIIMYQR